MDRFALECDDFLNAGRCSESLFSKLDIDITKIQAAVNDGIENMTIPAENKEYLETGGTSSFPDVSINNMGIPSNLKLQFVYFGRNL
jgi:hypothetical protein